ncbi:MAG: tRNA-dihydrouridine synthase, partial [Candidatus Bathyarchaeia archaeon]
MPISLITKIATLTLPNPTILSAGILGLTAKSLQAASHAGAGAVTTKSIGLEPRSGYPNPTIVSLRYGVLNAMGLPNPGAVNYLKELQVAKQESEGIIIVASVYGATPKEYAETAKILAKGGADAIELNLSCPNVKQT